MQHCDTVPLQTRVTLDPCRTNPRRQRGSWTTQWPITPFLLRELEIGPSARRSLPIVNTADETFNPVVYESQFFTLQSIVGNTSNHRNYPQSTFTMAENSASPYVNYHATALMLPRQNLTLKRIGIANLPNQRHKIVAKRGAAFTIMVSPLKSRLKLKESS